MGFDDPKWVMNDMGHPMHDDTFLEERYRQKEERHSQTLMDTKGDWRPSVEKSADGDH